MANKIYETTHDGLTHLVSARVASQVLDNALRAASCSAETVSVREMASVIKGPVVTELGNILPRAGLELSLKELLRTLKTLSSGELETAPSKAGGLEAEVAEVEARETALDDAPAATKDVRDIGESADAESADVESADVEGTAAAVSTAPRPNDPSGAEHATAVNAATPDLTRPEVRLELPFAAPPEASSERGLESVEAPAPRSPLRTAATLGPAARDAALLAFAELEHVEMVAAFEAGGVTSVRGGGFEIEALSRLGSLGLKLLSRSGELRTFYVAHSRGQLFLFPFGEVSLMLIGTNELNLGVVFATLHKLKEEL